MGNNWPTVTIEAIQANKKGAIAIGPFGSRLKSDNYVEVGIPVIRGTNLTGGKKLTGDFVFITEEKADSLGSSNVYQNDLVFPHRGSIGEVGIILDNERYVLSSSLMKLSVDIDKVNPLYLYYFFRSNVGRYELLKNASQVGTPGIGQPLSSLKSIAFKKPPLDVQNKIAKILSELDNKLTLNSQINHTLEQMAQALFKSWFVDFDPVVDNALDAGFFEQDLAFPDELLRRAEARRTVREHCDFKPLPNATRQLFPAAFEECAEPSFGLGGWVPQGWAVKCVSEAITINPKVNLAKNKVAKFVDMKALPTQGYSIEDVIEKPFTGGMKFQSDDVLLARITPCLQNGKTGIVDFLSENEAGFGSTEFIILRGNKNIHHTYIACLARYENFRQHVMQSMVGSSGRQRVQNGCFDDYQIAIPSIDIMSKFASLVLPSFKKFRQNTNESIALANLRDTLLPKLISDELLLEGMDADLAQEGAA